MVFPVKGHLTVQLAFSDWPRLVRESHNNLFEFDTMCSQAMVGKFKPHCAMHTFNGLLISVLVKPKHVAGLRINERLIQLNAPRAYQLQLCLLHS